MIEFFLTNFNDLGTFNKNDKIYEATISNLTTSNMEKIEDKKNFIDTLKDIPNIFKKNNKNNFIKEKPKTEAKQINAYLPNNMNNAKSYTIIVNKKETNILIDKLKNFFNISSIQKVTGKKSTYNKEHYQYGSLDNLNFRFTITKLIKDDNVKLNEKFVELIKGLYELEELSMDNLKDDLGVPMIMAALNSPSLENLNLGLLEIKDSNKILEEYNKYKNYIEDLTKKNKKSLNEKLLFNNSIKNFNLSFTEKIFQDKYINDFNNFFHGFILDLALRSRVETEGNIIINIKYNDTTLNNKNKEKILNNFNQLLNQTNNLSISDLDKKLNNQIKINVINIHKDEKNPQPSLESKNSTYNAHIKVF
jgi:hypothetical protein